MTTADLDAMGARGNARHGAVAFALLVALLGAFGSSGARAPDESLAAATAPPAPPPKPEPIDVAVTEAAPPAQPAPALVADDGLMAAGRRALENEGSLPPLIMDYDEVGFASYVDLLRGLGATAVVISGDATEVMGEIDLTTGKISAFRADRTYSPRARDYSDEPSVASTIARARRVLDDESVTVLVAVPATVDALLLGALVGKLDELGLEPGGFREFTGRYERAAGSTGAGGSSGLIAHIEHGTTHAGERHQLDVRVDIGSLTRYSGAAGADHVAG